MVIGLCGKKRVGKNTVADMIQSNLQFKDYKQYAIAGPLKRLVADWLNLSEEYIEGDRKEDEIFISYYQLTNSLRMYIFKHFDISERDADLISCSFYQYASEVEEDYSPLFGRRGGFPMYYKTTPRQVLQNLGTDAFRDFDDQFWLKLIPKNENLIITDIRFQNEYDYVKNLGEVIHISRDLKEDSNSRHSSEAGVSVEEDDFIIENNGTLQDLSDEVLNITEKL